MPQPVSGRDPAPGTPPGAPPDAPAWFRAALAAEPETGAVEVDGAAVAFRAWGPPGEGVLLIHGGAAHARWWDHLGPLLVEPEGRRVVAMDLSGHGDSGRRERYTLQQWAGEALAVADAAGLAPLPVILGHSMGGMVALIAAQEFGDRLGGAVAIDTPVREMPPEDKAARQRRAFGPLRVYAERERAIRHFRTVPPQDGEPYVLAHIAEHSLRAVEGGWSWKFDPRVFARNPLTPDDLDIPGCRVALFRAEHGLMPKHMGEMVSDRLGRGVPVVEIPAAAHHVMIDSPIALVTGLRTLLADWRHSRAATPGEVHA
ncbi:alpha/beta hydrolase [Pseudonocardia halophobica]|uniref:alpha/beta hydrolase n=1 Tax=Pseudonocardia halophobica TaxID=29401 RepID=UPI000AFB0EFB|nr:alpha/beta hydrolase [Pseudonocardia halophobica]